MNLTDPLTEDPRILLDRYEEALREQRWQEFIGWCRLELTTRTLPMLLSDVSVAYAYRHDTGDPLKSEDEQLILNFAEEEGWHSVLAAIAHAVKAQHQAEDEEKKEEKNDTRVDGERFVHQPLTASSDGGSE